MIIRRNFPAVIVQDDYATRELSPFPEAYEHRQYLKRPVTVYFEGDVSSAAVIKAVLHFMAVSFRLYGRVYDLCLSFGSPYRS